MIEFLNDIDTKLLIFLNGINSPFWDPIMLWITGRFEWIPFYAVIVFFIFKKFGYRGAWILISAALVVTLADQSSVKLFKNVFERLRPCHVSELQEVLHNIVRCGGGRFGFVSSHAANTFAVAMFLTHVFRVRWFTFFIFIWAAVVSYSRIYIGVHYPGDILGGALLGLLCGYLVWKLQDFVDKRYRLITPRPKS